MTDNEIRAIGFVFSFYKSDLLYIKNFQLYKKGIVSLKDYIMEDRRHCFQNYLAEFRIARCRKVGEDARILKVTSEWINSSKANDVNGFADKLLSKGLTHGRAVSFASKILMLNNPHKIFPIDGNVRDRLGVSENDYTEYYDKLCKYKRENEKRIKKCLRFVSSYTARIETQFPEIKQVEKIRENRMIDKLLWSVNIE